MVGLAHVRQHLRKTAVLIFSLVLVFILHLQSKDIPCHWSGVERIVAIADIHGDYDNFVRILKGVKLVDEDLNWIGGKTHLVQLGDIMDRGFHPRKAFDLLRKLETQAEAAGGKVHVLIGNHEESNIFGDAFETIGYIMVDQLLEFLSPEFIEKKEKPIKEEHGSDNNDDLILKSKLRIFWENEIVNQKKDTRKQYIKFFNDQYGKWLLEKNAVIKINDIIFTHGGVSEEFSNWDMGILNKVMRAELKDLSYGHRINYDTEVAYQPNSPLWFRGLIRSNEESFSDNVDRILANLQANYMVMGHTVRQAEFIETRKLDRFNGRIWGIDTGISSFYGGNLCALIIEKGNFVVWWGDDEKDN